MKLLLTNVKVVGLDQARSLTEVTMPKMVENDGAEPGMEECLMLDMSFKLRSQGDHKQYLKQGTNHTDVLKLFEGIMNSEIKIIQPQKTQNESDGS